ncbi:hypothetical protein N752_16800 [Desulforamulus aquiferis]|nr:hypothetical protein N752_16800 [Desulforamulus aquiferis]
MTGVILGCAARGIPVVIDGFISCAAAWWPIPLPL